MYCQLSPTVFQYPRRALQKILSALLTSLHSEDKRLVDKNSVEVPSVSPYLVVPLPLVLHPSEIVTHLHLITFFFKKKRSSNAANSFKEEEGRDYMRFDITEHERLGGLDKSITGYRSQTQASFYLLTVQ